METPERQRQELEARLQGAEAFGGFPATVTSARLTTIYLPTQALTLLDYLLKTGSERVAQQCCENAFTIQVLR